MISIARHLLAFALAGTLALSACEESGNDADDGHTHAPGEEHEHGSEAGDHHGQGDDGDRGRGHAGADPHEEGHGDMFALGPVELGGLTVRALQGHGEAAAGKELHLVVELPEEAAGSTVRAWIGTDDRLASMVALAEYSESGGGHELHAVAPDPLPENAAWWIEVERSDGTTHVGSVPLH